MNSCDIKPRRVVAWIERYVEVLEKTVASQDPREAESVVKSGANRYDVLGQAKLNRVIIDIGGRSIYDSAQFTYIAIFYSESKHSADVRMKIGSERS